MSVSIPMKSRSPWAVAIAWFICSTACAQAAAPMSYSNRQLLNRAVVTGEQRIEVMLLARDGSIESVKRAVSEAGGSLRKEIPEIGYLRVELDIAKLIDIGARADVERYQIATGANMIWEQEGRNEATATMYRSYETWPPRGESRASKKTQEQHKAFAGLPMLTAAQSRAAGFTADNDTGVTAWHTKHPKWDGRGVTVAVLESAQPEFQHPTLRSALDLAGKPVPKIAGILNTTDPRSGDNTRVAMSTRLEAAGTWQRIDGRTYILPTPGSYRFGIYSVPVGSNLRQNFGVLWSTTSGDIWVDCDGDASFANESPMRRVDERFDVRQLTFTQPMRYTMDFVVGAAREADALHIYTSRGGHQAMTASVAAGSLTDDGLASGVAPNARVLFVRNQEFGAQAYDFIEGYAQIAARPDVDVLSDSRGVEPQPNMTQEFYSMAFQRIAKAWGKPVFHSGGNNLPGMGLVSAIDGVFAVGGSIGPQTYAALYGGAELPHDLKHPLMSEGPGGDGALKPDFIAPMHRISAERCANDDKIFLPKNKPAAQLPPCYSISCCTSASGPYATGMAALLISAARQNDLKVSRESLGRALSAGARFLTDVPAYTQGAGLLDINAAWKELQRAVDVPSIRVSAPVAQPLTRYAQGGAQGPGLFEFGGWQPGQSGERMMHFTRGSGAKGAQAYRLSWTGNDGTFTAAQSLSLPLNETKSLPVGIKVSSFGPHSAILNLHDSRSDAIVHRVLLTVVAPRSIPVTPGSQLQLDGQVPLMQSDSHFISVPAGVAALKVEIDVRKGVLTARMRSMDPTSKAEDVGALQFTQLRPGKYTWVVAAPPAGTWDLGLTNDSGWREADLSRVSTDEAQYSLAFTALTSSIEGVLSGGQVSIRAPRDASPIESPAVDVYAAARDRRTERLQSNGEPRILTVDVPNDAGVMKLRATADPGSSEIEMFLYDCTTGQCFWHSYAGLAAAEQVITVRKPKAGRWKVAVNAGPAANGTGGFALEQIVGGKAARSPLQGDGAMWRASIARPESVAKGDSERVLYLELVDEALENAESQRILALAPDDAPEDKKRPAKPVGLASTVIPVG